MTAQEVERIITTLFTTKMGVTTRHGVRHGFGLTHSHVTPCLTPCLVVTPISLVSVWPVSRSKGHFSSKQSGNNSFAVFGSMP